MNLADVLLASSEVVVRIGEAVIAAAVVWYCAKAVIDLVRASWRVR